MSPRLFFKFLILISGQHSSRAAHNLIHYKPLILNKYQINLYQIMWRSTLAAIAQA